MNYIQMKRLEKKWESYIRRSINAYERGDGLSEIKWSNRLTDEVIRYGASCSWPGLYPCFRLGSGPELYTVESLVSAIGEDLKA